MIARDSPVKAEDVLPTGNVHHEIQKKKKNVIPRSFHEFRRKKNA